ncbi:MAG: dihydroorotase [Armatimonadota bacterium]|nr:dihydroorotase [Armatimonadota bacterium]
MWALLRNGQVIDPFRDYTGTADVLIAGGSVAALIDRCDRERQSLRTILIQLDLDERDGQVFDCSGFVICPGLIDIHVHLREPGYEYKETIATGARAAAAGGFTTVVAMPNTMPAVDNGAVVRYVLDRGRETPIRVFTAGAATKANNGAEMAEIADMVEAGAIALSDDAFPIQSADLMRRVMEYARMFNIPILTHCEDKSMTQDAVMNEGLVCTILGLRPWPRQAEEIMIWRNILLADLTGCRVHIQHVTTRGGVEAVRWAKSRGIPVSCETCPHYFSLTDEALLTFDTNAKCCPPLRTSDDVEALKEGLADGTIDIIASDHAPHAQEEKEVEFQDAAFGIVGLETAVPIVITNLVKTGTLTIEQAISKMTAAPAKLLGLSGGLAVGSAADITVLDPNCEVVINSSTFQSKGRNTPFDGWKLSGKVVATIVNGEIVSGELKTVPIEDCC